MKPEPASKPPKAVAFVIRIAFIVAPIFFFVQILSLRKNLGISGRGGYDEVNFHNPAILQFAADWPLFNLHDYLSATTPGYHIAQATMVHILGPTAMPVVSAAVVVALLVSTFASSLFSLAQGHRGQLSTRVIVTVVGGSALIIAPLFTSPYILASGIWLLPDNLAWLLVFESLFFALAAIARPKYLIHSAIALLFLVAVRQIHLWAAAPIVAGAFCSFQLIASSPPPARFLSELRETLTTHLAKRIPFALLAALLTLPSLLLLYYFFNLWQGLTPPTFQGQYPIDPSKPLLLRLFNAPAAPAFILALFGVFGVFYAGFWLPALLKSLKTRGVFPLLMSALFLALLLATIPATTESMPLGRWSGLWQFTSKLPIIAGHTSTLILSLALLGAITLCGFLTSMRASHAVVCFTAIAGFAAAQAASFQLWQRYNEPFILIMLILMTTIIIAQREEKEPALAPLLSLIHRLRFAGPAILAIALGALSYTTFKNAKPSEFFDLKPGTDRTRAFLKGDESIKPVPMPRQNP